MKVSLKKKVNTRIPVAGLKRLATLLVEEDNKIRNRLPVYFGLDRFKMINKIGEGAFSNVFEAYDSYLQKKVALKISRKPVSDKNRNHERLHCSVMKKPKVTERTSILKEVQIMKGINHPNIVQLIHYMEDDENYFLALEFCNGGDLFHQIVKLTYFSEELSRHVIIQVAQAVRYLHKELGVVHRDIKPENILFEPIPIIPSKYRVFKPTDDVQKKMDEGEFCPNIGGGGIGRIKLADFGLSKVVWDNSTSTPCGTVGYTAPEIAKHRNHSKSVDIWAIGCVLYTTLCGFPPFYDESIESLKHKVAHGQYSFLSPWWDTQSTSVKNLISHLLCVDVEQRYTIDEFFEHPWVSQEVFTSSRPPMSTSEIRDFVQQNKKQHALFEEIEDQELAEMNQPHKVNKTPELIAPNFQQKSKLLKNYENTSAYNTPTTSTLRDIFGVTNAVQRMINENQALKTNLYLEQDKAELPNRPETLNQTLLDKKNNTRNNPELNYPKHPMMHKKMFTHLPPFQGKDFQLNLSSSTLLKNRKNYRMHV